MLRTNAELRFFGLNSHLFSSSNSPPAGSRVIICPVVRSEAERGVQDGGSRLCKVISLENRANLRIFIKQTLKADPEACNMLHTGI